MNLRLNRLGDDGGQTMCKALMKNATLEELNLGSNDLGEPTAAALAQVLKSRRDVPNCMPVGGFSGVARASFSKGVTRGLNST